MNTWVALGFIVVGFVVLGSLVWFAFAAPLMDEDMTEDTDEDDEAGYGI